MKKALENTVANGENAGNQHFLLFPQCFLPYQGEKSSFYQHLLCYLENAFKLDQAKSLSSGKELKHEQEYHVAHIQSLRLTNI